MSWRERALCRWVPDMPWDDDGKPTVEQLRVCLACPVLVRCADVAAAQAWSYASDGGVMAAASRSQRDEVRRGRKSWDEVWSNARRRVETHDLMVERRLVRWMLGEAGRVAEGRVA